MIINIIKFILRLIAKIVGILADVEAYFSSPGSPIFFRRLQFILLGIKYHRPLWVGAGIRIQNPRRLKIGVGCAIPSNTQFVNHEEILIGDDFIAAPDLVVNSGGHDPISLHPVNRPVRIGNRVWCGQRVTILSGVTIGDDVVIAAGSVVNTDIPANSVCAGVPARVIREIDRRNINLWKWYK